MTRKIKSTMVSIFCLLFSISVPIFSSGVSESSSSIATETDRIIVYASGPAQMLEKLEQQFEKQHGDVLDIVQMGCGSLRQRVWTESESGLIKADVFWGSDPLIYDALDEKGALEAYIPLDIERVRDKFITDKNYILVNERYGVIIYNGDKLQGDAIPHSYTDLLSPIYKDKITHADPAQSSTALAIVASLWDLFDQNWDYQTNLVKNGLFLAKKNSDVPSKIQEGEFDVGIAPHDAVLRLQKKAKSEGFPTPLKISWPSEGSIAIPRPIAISSNEERSTIKREITHLFVDYMLSIEAQAITSSFGFVSVRKDIPIPDGVPNNLKTKLTNWDVLSLQQDYIRNEFKNIAK